MLKVLSAIFAISSVVLFTVGCGTDHAKVRFVHASSDAGSLDGAVDGKTVVTDLAFGGISPATDYLTIAAGNRRVEFRSAGTTTDLINSIVDFGSQTTYTLLVSGKSSDDSVAALLKTDDNSAPSSGNIKLRVIHDAPDGFDQIGPVHIDIYVVAPGTDIASVTPTISNLAYQQASDYQSLPAATYEVIVTNSGDKSDNPRSTLVLTAGQIRTLVTVNVEGEDTMSTTPLVLNDLN